MIVPKSHELTCIFQEGVGDTRDSYAYDGRRQRKWNATTQKYGEVLLLLSEPFTLILLNVVMHYTPPQLYINIQAATSTWMLTCQ